MSNASHQSLFTELERAAGRVRLRRFVRESAWLAGTLCTLLGVHQAFAGLGVPGSVLEAVRPLLLLVAIATSVWCAWRLLRRIDLFAVATELDDRAALKDELKSACWFASRESTTAWETLLLARAARTLHGIDTVATLPVRLSGGPALAAGVGAFVLVLGLLAGRLGVGRVGDDPEAQPEATITGMGRGASTRQEKESPEGHARAPLVAGGVAPPTDGKPTERRAGATADGSGVTQGGSLPGAQPPAFPPGSPTLGHAASGAAAPSVGLAGGSVDRAPDLSLDVAKGVIERLQSALGSGGPQSERAEPGEALTAPLAGGQADITPRQEAPQEHTTLDALTEALRGLSKTPDGDRPMLDAGTPGGSPQGGGRTTITGGASGMRVNLSDAGDGGGDTPPEAPLAEPRSVQGKKTERLGMQINRPSTGPAGAQSAGDSEGFYAASQAQAARVEFDPSAGAVRGTSEVAQSTGRVPLTYRGVVKRYFLNEHGRQP